ncbi:hypothetical protein Caka_2275 [Coraliomargarita akajimensis DSM 45221]|uniref:Uncharacterized protein n=1 Tax=Coraliomargarita akajimensis (strain DSM 45221 / IAM 15411 / JCM 23193 / KCTC 12865 / 04OKA010-24) TaxID=583355 RepID=D5EMQ2_CORAD|nr:hypothetical protein Caka_2275 [Coraliomargarita akajimensis DSM 45221]
MIGFYAIPPNSAKASEGPSQPARRTAPTAQQSTNSGHEKDHHHFLNNDEALQPHEWPEGIATSTAWAFASRLPKASSKHGWGTAVATTVTNPRM